MARQQPKAIEMFKGGADLPLFSGVAPKAEIREFKPEEAVRQQGLFVGNVKYVLDPGEW